MRPSQVVLGICSLVFFTCAVHAQEPEASPPPAAAGQPAAGAAQPAPAQSAPTATSPVVTLESPPSAAPTAGAEAQASPPAQPTEPQAAAGSSAPPADTGPQPAAAPRIGAPEPAPAVVRDELKFAIAGEVGWNSLAGLGVNGTYNVIPYLSLELGAGLSTVGYKLGVRARGNLLDSEWTPVVGVGYLFGSGTGGETVDVESDGDEASFRIYHSHYVQGVFGVNYTGTGGFAFMATAGYAWLLRENFKYVSGSDDLLDNVRPQMHGGVVVATSFGWAF